MAVYIRRLSVFDICYTDIKSEFSKGGNSDFFCCLNSKYFI